MYGFVGVELRQMFSQLTHRGVIYVSSLGWKIIAGITRLRFLCVLPHQHCRCVSGALPKAVLPHYCHVKTNASWWLHYLCERHSERRLCETRSRFHLPAPFNFFSFLRHFFVCLQLIIHEVLSTVDRSFGLCVWLSTGVFLTQGAQKFALLNMVMFAGCSALKYWPQF